MSLTRRIRGTIGTALTWGVFGAIVGIPTFVAVMRPWPLSAIRWERFLKLFAFWEGASTLWGFVCGLAFAFVFLAFERTRGLHQLSRTRVAAWGALAGAAFPALLFVRPLLDGASVPYFGGIILASGLAGAIWARMTVALARRAPAESESAALSNDVAPAMPDFAQAARDRVH